MSKKKPIKTEWNQDDRRDLSDMSENEIKEFRFRSTRMDHYGG